MDWEVTFDRRISSNGLRVFLHGAVTLREKAGESGRRRSTAWWGSECSGEAFVLVGCGAGGRAGGEETLKKEPSGL